MTAREIIPARGEEPLSRNLRRRAATSSVLPRARGLINFITRRYTSRARRRLSNAIVGRDANITRDSKVSLPARTSEWNYKSARAEIKTRETMQRARARFCIFYAKSSLATTKVLAECPPVRVYPGQRRPPFSPAVSAIDDDASARLSSYLRNGSSVRSRSSVRRERH